MLPKSLKEHLGTIFLAEEKTQDGLATESARRFLTGITVWKQKTRMLIPLELAAGYGFFMLCLIIADHIVSPKSNWIDKFIAYNITYPIILESLVVLRNRQGLQEISHRMDCWWEHSYLQDESVFLKKKAVTWVERFTSVYYTVMIFGFLSYLLLPIFKYWYNGCQEILDIFIYHCWCPISVQTPWGFGLLYLLEMGGLYLPFFAYAGIGTYLVTMTRLFGAQVDLLCVVLPTAQDRVRKQVSDNPGSSFTALMKVELRNCARHYHSLYWCLSKMCKIFAPTTNIMYYNGLCVVVYAGLQVVLKPENPLFVVQSVVLIFAVFVNQYLNSYVTESLADKADELRMAVYSCGWEGIPLACRKDIQLLLVTASHSPKLTTILGSVCNKESFMTITNASYYYINTLITMNIHL